MTLNFTLRSAAGTHPGRIRDVNQDSVFAFVRSQEKGGAFGLFIVADGMGGHKAGEIASKLAINTIKDSLGWLLDQDDDAQDIVTQISPSLNGEIEPEELLKQRLAVAVEDANFAIFEYAKKNPVKAGNLGCTVTCAIVSDNTAIIANVGDSRTYRLNGSELEQITHDHSYVWQLLQDGYIEPHELYEHPQRNVITRALGSRSQVEVDTWICTLEPGDKLLLCSDGMWEMIRDPMEIAFLMKEEELEIAIKHLIETSIKYGGLDNIGVVIAELLDDQN